MIRRSDLRPAAMLIASVATVAVLAQWAASQSAAVEAINARTKKIIERTEALERTYRFAVLPGGMAASVFISPDGHEDLLHVGLAVDYFPPSEQ